MYLIDTCVISENRKKNKANKGVTDFFQKIQNNPNRCYLSVITMGELRRGAEKIRHRGDILQYQRLNQWIMAVSHEYNHHILGIDADIAQMWGQLRVPRYENAIDKLIAATALIYDLTVVTRNIDDFHTTGCKLLNPFL